MIRLIFSLSMILASTASASKICQSVLEYRRENLEAKISEIEMDFRSIALSYQRPVTVLPEFDSLRVRFRKGSSAEKERVMQLLDFSRLSLTERRELVYLIPGSIFRNVEHHANFEAIDLQPGLNNGTVEAGGLKYYAGLPEVQFLLRNYGIIKATVLSEKGLKIHGGYLSGWTAVKIRIETARTALMKPYLNSTLPNDITVYVGYMKESGGSQKRIVATLRTDLIPTF